MFLLHCCFLMLLTVLLINFPQNHHDINYNCALYLERKKKKTKKNTEPLKGPHAQLKKGKMDSLAMLLIFSVQ